MIMLCHSISGTSGTWNLGSRQEHCFRLRHREAGDSHGTAAWAASRGEIHPDPGGIDLGEISTQNDGLLCVDMKQYAFHLCQK
jgi:hypothetical protein